MLLHWQYFVFSAFQSIWSLFRWLWFVAWLWWLAWMSLAKVRIDINNTFVGTGRDGPLQQLSSLLLLRCKWWYTLMPFIITLLMSLLQPANVFSLTSHSSRGVSHLMLVWHHMWWIIVWATGTAHSTRCCYALCEALDQWTACQF